MTTERAPFPCTACGKCCRHVDLSEATAYLSRGDGICRHFDKQTKLCTIYHERPLVCRVEDYYRSHLATEYTWPQFVAVNLEICARLPE